MRIVAFCIAFLFVPCAARAQQPQEEPRGKDERIRALEERVRTLEELVGRLVAAQSAGTMQPAVYRLASMADAPPRAAVEASTSPSSATTPAQQPPQFPQYGGAAASASKVFNPDIGVIGNFVGAVGRNTINPFPALSLQESEVSLQAVVDPYARADFFLAVGEEGIEVEEGYLTFPALPGGFVAKVGRMRASFGRVNSFHNHTLPWVDRPLVTFNLMGGALEEADVGIKDAGFSLSRILPAPGGLFLEVTGEVFRGDSGSVFQASRRSDVSTVARLRAYRDVTEATNLELGGSYARGHNDNGTDFVTELFGFDATLRWKPLRRAIYRSFAARTELVWSRREDPLADQRAFGLFTSVEYRLTRRWFLGGRHDWSQRARDAALHDSGGSVFVTYWPSEFSQIRGQFRRTRFAERETSNELLLQFLFTIGTHGAHPF